MFYYQLLTFIFISTHILFLPLSIYILFSINKPQPSLSYTRLRLIYFNLHLHHNPTNVYHSDSNSCYHLIITFFIIHQIAIHGKISTLNGLKSFIIFHMLVNILKKTSGVTEKNTIKTIISENILAHPLCNMLYS